MHSLRTCGGQIDDSSREQTLPTCFNSKKDELVTCSADRWDEDAWVKVRKWTRYRLYSRSYGIVGGLSGDASRGKSLRSV